MSLQQIIADAYLDFTLRVANLSQRKIIIRRFAFEELKLSHTLALKYISTNSFEIKEDNPTDKFRTFFLWYHIHYIQAKKPAQRFNCEVYANQVEPFEKTTIYPVLLATEHNQVTIKRCDPDRAEFWTVNLHLPDGQMKCVADCVDQDAAQEMDTFIHEIATKYIPIKHDEL